jgi:drug/metabolite transporter (DMT)-like permease
LESGKTKYNALLLLAAMIWGGAFVAQSVAMKHLGPFTFNGIRFGLGSVCLLPVILVSSKKQAVQAVSRLKNAWLPGLITGAVLFATSFLQTLGITYTTVGKAGFITGLYIVFVPVTGIFLKHANGPKVWLSVGIAAIGLYLLCVQGDLTIAKGDLLVLASAVFCTAQILLVDRFSKRIDAFTFAFTQSLTCSVLSVASALLFEGIDFANVLRAAVPILYGGVFSAGIAFTLQVIGQRWAKPSHAALIMSMESVFAALAGWLLLNEHMALKEYIGCFLMLGGMLLTQIPSRQKNISAPAQNDESGKTL